MIQTPRTFRVFVSSTFSDLKAERNALQEKVFPMLRELCFQHGCRFQAIDLRWGVSEEAALDQQAMRICLEEVERCQKLSPRPNFIVLLGDRYGWQPLPYEIPAEEFEKIAEHIDPVGVALLYQWYRRDDNAVPPVYCLLPREGLYEDFSVWEPVEKELLSFLRRAVGAISLSPESSIKYYSSATEQEIVRGALNAPGSEKHVFCFFRNFGILPEGTEASEYLDLDEMPHKAIDSEAYARLQMLKTGLRERLPGNVHDYDARWENGTITTEHIEQLCDDVYAELSGIILKEIEGIQNIDPFEMEIVDHRSFGQERARYFTGRQEVLDSIHAYTIRSGNHQPLVIHGESGSGKSALIAFAAQKAGEAHTQSEIILRHIGATPASSSIRALLESLCRQITRACGQDESSIPTEYKELVEEFHKRLSLATEEKPFIIFIDALDQLSDMDNARNLIWMPHDLPDHVRIIVSTITGDDSHKVLMRRLSVANILALSPMQVLEGETLLNLWLKDAGRTLQQEQQKEVLDKFSRNGMPLYLRLAFEEAMKWESSKLSSLSTSIHGIVSDLFDRLSLDSNHGDIMMSRSLAYIAAAKNGLTEDELIDVLSEDAEVMEDFQRRSPKSPVIDRLPVVVWSRLYLDLKPYLTERSADNASVMMFFHRQFGEVVREQYLSGEDKNERHRALAKYFAGQPYQIESEGRKAPNYRKVSEIAYQQMHGELWEELEITLTDFDFPMAKSMAWMVDELVEDYQKANGSPVPDKQAMRIWAAFFKERVHILRRGNEDWPAYKILFQLAMEHADESPVTKQSERYLEEGNVDWMWLFRPRRLRKPQLSPCVAVMEGHIDQINNAVELRDGRILSWSWDKTLRLWDNNGHTINILEGHSKWIIGATELRDGRILSWSGDNTLRLWDKDGYHISILIGHTDLVNRALELIDGRILSWSEDMTLRLWNRDGIHIKNLEGHTHSVDRAIELRDGRIVSNSDDKTMRLWDKDGNLILILKHTDLVKGAHELIDGRILSWSNDKSLILWDIDRAPVMYSYQQLNGHNDLIKGVKELRDGRILSWSEDKTLRLWDKNGLTLKVIEGHTDSVMEAIEMKGGPLLSRSLDGSLRLWDKDGKFMKVITKHTDGWFVGAIELKDGRILSWSGDTALQLYDIDGHSMGELKGHHYSIRGARQLNDGRILSWSDYTIRIWDQDVQTIDELNGHSKRFNGAIGLRDGRILSWSEDKTLRLWDIDGNPVKVIKGHTGAVNGAIEIKDGRIISWSDDKTLRFWDCNGQPIKVLDGHSKAIIRAIALTDGRILSWSEDNTLRLWDCEGILLRVLEGHNDSIVGATELGISRTQNWFMNRLLWLKQIFICSRKTVGGRCNLNKGTKNRESGRILSWSMDRTLRLWDNNGHPIKVLDGHSNGVINIQVLADGKIQSFDSKGKIILWSKHGNKMKDMKLSVRIEDWVAAVQGDFKIKNGLYFKKILFGTVGIIGSSKERVLYALWNAESHIENGIFKHNGTGFCYMPSGQFCFLKLYHGNKRISIDELEQVFD